MKKLFFIFIMSLMFCACYDSKYIGEEIEPQQDKNNYMIYENNILRNYDSCQVILTLEPIDHIETNIYKNQKVKIMNSEIRINLFNSRGSFKRYMHILVIPDLDLMVNDTVKI